MWPGVGVNLGWRLPRISGEGQEDREAEDGEEVVEEIPPQEKGVRSRGWEQGGGGGREEGEKREREGRRGEGEERRERHVWVEVMWGHQSRWGQCPVGGPSDKGRGW